MENVNKVLEVTKNLIKHEDVPSAILAAQDAICKLYKYDLGRSFIRVESKIFCLPLHICGYKLEPRVCIEESGIDIYRAYYYKTDEHDNGVLNEMMARGFIHTKEFHKYSKALQSIGYIPTEGKEVTEASIRFVRGTDIGIFGFFVFEKHDGQDPLSETELDEITTLLEVLTNKIETFETKKQLEEEEKQSSIDALTGLMNLKSFKQEVVKAQNNDNQYAMIYLDVDKFKYINELWSHQKGSEIIVAIGATVKAAIKEDEYCCRISDDKFGCFIQYKDDDDLAYRVCCLNSSLKEMQKKQFPDIKITMIGGIYKAKEEKNVDVILDKANIARLSSKGKYDNACIFYNQEIEEIMNLEKELENKTKKALENDEFIPFLQPKFNVQTNKISGMEALVRWKSGDKIIGPYGFIDVFEKNGVITKLDFVIYEKVFKFMNYCMEKGYPLYPVSLNVSRVHMLDETFITRIMDLKDKYQISSDLIELEITESVFVEDEQLLLHFIDLIKEKGIKVSIDDFGTAYSALNLLKELDVDIIKMDKSFIDDLSSGYEGKDKIIIKNIVNMNKELQMEVIFEGIETADQLEFIKQTGCLYGQGYIFSKPVSLEEFEEKYLKEKVLD